MLNLAIIFIPFAIENLCKQLAKQCKCNPKKSNCQKCLYENASKKDQGIVDGTNYNVARQSISDKDLELFCKKYNFE